jgi:hypothetical protein
MQRPTEKDVKDIIKSQWTDNAMSIGFWLHLWHLYLLAIALSVHWLLITSLTSFSVGHCIFCPLASDYIFDIFICWPLHCLSNNR